MSELLQRVGDDGDRRSLGTSSELVEEVLADPASMNALLEAFDSDDPVLRMRVADSLEKVSVLRPDVFVNRSAWWVDLAEREVQHEVRWHLAQILPRLTLAEAQRVRAVQALWGYLEDKKSTIVRTSAMDALYRLAQGDPKLMGRVRELLEEKSQEGTPAERARARKLLRGQRRVPKKK